MKTNYSLLCLFIFLGCGACRDIAPVILSDVQLQQSYENVQLSLAAFLELGNDFGARFSRMTPLLANSTEEAIRNYSPQQPWISLNSGLDGEVKAVIHAAEQKESHFLSGSMKVMKTFMYFSMMDVFLEGAVGPVYGDPDPERYGDSFPSDTNYQRGIRYLDHAIADLEKGGELPALDIFYNGDASKWIKLARSLQLRAYNNIRLVYPEAKDKINALLREGNFIENIEEDFQFLYGTGPSSGQVESRWFQNTYKINFTSTVFPPYLSNYYMWLVVGEKAVPDPRTRYYFYRQTADFSKDEAFCGPVSLDPGNLPQAPSHYVEIDPNMPYCLASTKGYFGRDHGMPIDFPSDQRARTAVGLYPYGGKFDDNSFDNDVHGNRVFANGKGIFPILLSSFISFIRAEAALTLGTDDDPIEMLEMGIRQSFAKVKSFEQYLEPTCPVSSCAVVDSLMAESEQQLETYVAFVLDQYRATNDPEKKLDIIMKEYLIALWGNGWEAYNNYRRTAMPLNIQPPVEPERIGFIRSALHFTRAFSVGPGFQNKPVFWDTNDASKFR